MEAAFRKITITPVKLDAEGDVKKREGATIVFDIPLDSTEQKVEILNLLNLLSDEWVTLNVLPKQLKLDLAANG